MTGQVAYQAPVAELEEAFQFFSENGMLDVQRLPDVFRALGVAITNEQGEAIVNAVRSQHRISFAVFNTLYQKTISRLPNPEDEIRQSFDILNENGFVLLNRLKHLLITTGDRMNAEDVEKAFEGAPERLDFTEFRTRLLPRGGSAGSI
ncbi:MAG: hypothetical protein MHM6MM_003122 [Cercozoa sp. M6MM]